MTRTGLARICIVLVLKNLWITVESSKGSFEKYGHGFDNETVELEHEKRERMSDFPDYRVLI